MRLPSIFHDRLVFGRVLALLILAWVIISVPPEYDASATHRISFGVITLLMVCVAAFGRVWATFFLGGNKNICLIKEGPFSVCRNPLYLFTSFGALGIAMESHQLPIVVAVACFMLVYYGIQVRREEHDLTRLFGQSYLDYTRSTPRFLPCFDRYRPPAAHMTTNSKLVHNAMRDNLWWLIVWYIVHESSFLKAPGLKIVVLPNWVWF